MLRTRVISSIIGLPLILAALFFGGKLLAALVFLLSIIGLYEYFNAFKNIGFKPSTWVGYFGTIVYYSLIVLNKNSVVSFSLILFIIILLLFFDSIKRNSSIIDAALTILGMIYIPCMFSNIIFLQNGINGKAIVWLPFITAWLSDTFAYFAGITLGKNKLCPKISPKKTIEGSLGGIIGSLVSSLVAGIIFNSLGFFIPLIHFGIIGALSGAVGQIGDLFASSIKRFCKIKDYGNIIPGHGGILDRFDSILFTAPTVYFYFVFIVGNL